MKLLSILAKVHRAMDFVKGNKTKIGVALVVVGKGVALVDQQVGEAIEKAGEAIAGYGLAMAVTRPAANAIE